MTTFKAKVVEDIPAYRLVGLGGIYQDPEEGWDTPLLIPSRLGWIPDFVTSRELKAGEYVTVTVKDEPVWAVEAAEDLRAGTLVQSDEDGRVRHYNPSNGPHFGYTVHSAKAGEVVKVVRKYGGAYPQSQIDAMTQKETKPKRGRKKAKADGEE